MCGFYFICKVKLWGRFEMTWFLLLLLLFVVVVKCFCLGAVWRPPLRFFKPWIIFYQLLLKITIKVYIIELHTQHAEKFSAQPSRKWFLFFFYELKTYSSMLNLGWMCKISWLDLSLLGRTKNFSISVHNLSFTLDYIVLSMELRIHHLYPLQEVPTSQRGLLAMTLNCICWWSFSSGDLGSVESPLLAMTPMSTPTQSGGGTYYYGHIYQSSWYVSKLSVWIRMLETI